MTTTGRLTVTTPGDTEIVMTRRFDAPRHRVFAALTRPELLKRWYGARGWNLVDCEIDLRVGGGYRFVSRGPDGATMATAGEYREVAPPGRLVYTEAYDDQWYPGESLVTTVLEERGGGTTVITTLRYPTREIRDAVLEWPMERGLGESFDRLDDVLRSPHVPDADQPRSTS